MPKTGLLIIVVLCIAGCATTSPTNQGWNELHQGSEEAAFRHFKQGVENNNPKAYTAMAAFYDPDQPFSVPSVAKDRETAVRYYRAAIRLDEPVAMNNLGLMLYESGNMRAGAELITRSARWGNTKAIENLRFYDLPVPRPDLLHQKQAIKKKCESYAASKYDQKTMDQTAHYASVTDEYGALAAMALLQGTVVGGHYEDCMKGHGYK